MITEICGMIRAAQEGDAARVLDVARLLAENFDKAGDHQEANRIYRALSYPTLQSRPVALDDLPPAPYSGDFNGSSCGDLQSHDY